MSPNGVTVPQGLDGIVPPELLARFLDFLDLRDLLHVMAVNKRWQDTALEHPTYWRDLSLDEFGTMQPTQVRLFRLRLFRSRDRPVSVVLRFFPYESSEPEAQLLPDLAQHLSHMQYLDYSSGDNEIHEALFNALAHPAPIIRTLRLSVHRSDPITIREDLLGGFAPELRTVTFKNADVPSPIPPCLRIVEYLGVISASIPDLTQGCPHLRDLHLCLDAKLHPAYLEERAWRGIRRVCFDAGVIARDWHRLGLAVARIPKLIVRSVYTSVLGDPGSAAGLAALAAHVGGGVGVHVARNAPHLLWVDLLGTSEVSSALERGMMFVNQERPDAETPLPFPGSDLAADFSHRVVYLSIDLASWEIAHCLGELPVLDTLVLMLQNIELVPLDPAQLSCPRIQRLVLRGVLREAFTSVALLPFAQFARCALVAAQFPLALEFQRVELLAGQDPQGEPQTFRSPTITELRGDDSRWL